MRRDRLGLVFQQFNLIPSLNVADNLVFQSRIAGRHDAAWHGELVERLGLGALLKRYPEQLSGGQQQRVAIGRALAVKPLLLLADEPTGNLDEATADEVLALARDLVSANRLRLPDGDPQRAAGCHARPPDPSQRRADRMTRMIWILAVLLSHWRRHPMQLATLLIGLISATALWSGVQALNQQARLSYDRAAATFGGTRTAMLVGRNSATFPQQLFVDLRRAGWPVSPVLEGRVQIDGRSFRLLGIEPVTLPAEVGNAPAIGKTGLQSFLTPPGETLVAPEMLTDLNLPEGAAPLASGGTLLPPLRVQAQLVPGVLVVDIGIAQRLLNMPDRISRLLIGKAKGPRAPLETIAGDKLRLVEPDAESDLERLTDSFHLNLTAFGLLSFVVGLFIVNSAIGLAFEQRLPMLRTLRACGVSARMLNAVLLIELVSLALAAGAVGLVCGYLIAASLLPDVAASLRGLYGAQIPGQLTLKPQWWIAGLAISVIGALAAATASLVKAIRLSGAGSRAALCLATGAAPLADSAKRAGARRVRRCGLLSVVRRFAGFGICRARGVAAWRGAGAARDAGVRAVAGPAKRPSRARDLVLGRQPPAAFGIVAGVDGAAAGARGQCRRRHHGRNLQPHLCQLARRTAGGGRLHQCLQTTRRRPRSRHGCASVPKSRRSCRAAGPTRKSMARRSKFWACPITPPIAITGRCCNPPPTPGSGFVPAMPASSANNWRGV